MTHVQAQNMIHMVNEIRVTLWTIFVLLVIIAGTIIGRWWR